MGLPPSGGLGGTAPQGKTCPAGSLVQVLVVVTVLSIEGGRPRLRRGVFVSW